MNTSRLVLATVITAVLAATASVSFAQEAVQDPIASVTSTLTREQVKAEYLEARRNGTLQYGDRNTFPSAKGTPLTREQVLAELHEARRLGLLWHGEASRMPTALEAELVRRAGQSATSGVLANR